MHVVVPRAAKYFVNKECFHVTDQELNALVMRLIMQTNACIRVSIIYIMICSIQNSQIIAEPYENYKGFKIFLFCLVYSLGCMASKKLEGM
jgi:hypothetical protein